MLTNALVVRPTLGSLIGAVISLARLLRRGAQPHVAFLGRIPGTRQFSDLKRHPDNEVVPGAVLFRVEARLLYVNADHVRAAVLKRVRQPGEVRLVVCDLSTSPQIDRAGARMLAELQRDLAASEIGFRIVGAEVPVQNRLRAEGLAPKVGDPNHFTSLADVIDDFLDPL